MEGQLGSDPIEQIDPEQVAIRMKPFLPFRLGTTSYIWPDDILPNVRQLAPLVDDIELVLFESDEYGSNLPDKEVVAELKQLALEYGLTYTVHLPIDLRLGDEDSARNPSLEKARRVIERTQSLDPFAYVVHLEGENAPFSLAATLGGAEGQLAHWQAQGERSLEQIADWVGDANRVCVENLENYDPVAFAPVLDLVRCSRCVDVGHLWLSGLDPLPHLRQWQSQTRVVHMHGVGEDGHQSLALMPPDTLDSVVRYLLENMRGVVTLEVFGVDDFFSSKAAVEAAVERCR